MPPDPATSSSSYRSARTSPSSNDLSFPACASLMEGRPERLFPDAERLLELSVRDHERSEDTDAVAVDAAGDEQEAASQRFRHDRARERGRRLLRGRIRD